MDALEMRRGILLMDERVERLGFHILFGLHLDGEEGAAGLGDEVNL